LKSINGTLINFLNSKLFGNLDEIICWKFTRMLKNNWTLQLNKEHYQLTKSCEKIVKPRYKITVKRYLNGDIKFWYKDSELKYEKLNHKPATLTELAIIQKRKDKELLEQMKKDNKKYSFFNSNNIRGYQENISGNNPV